MRRWTTALIAGGLLSCTPVTEAPIYFPRPFFQYTAGDGVCFRTVLVDGQNQGWTSQSCDQNTSGFHQTRMVAAADVASIQAAFDALPQTKVDPSSTSNDLGCEGAHFTNGTITRLWRGLVVPDGGTATTAENPTWTACVSGDALASPYKEAVDLLQQFAGQQ